MRQIPKDSLFVSVSIGKNLIFETCIEIRVLLVGILFCSWFYVPYFYWRAYEQYLSNVRCDVLT